MRKTLNIKDLARKTKTNPHPVICWAEGLRAVFVLSVFIVLLAVCPALFAQNPAENSSKRWLPSFGSANSSNSPDDSSSERRRILPVLTAPLHAVLPSHTKETQTENNIDSELPGFGTLRPKPSIAKPASLGSQLLGNSVEAVSPQPSLIPAIYIEGEGYIPITHPNLKPYMSPSVLKHPESEPSIVMVSQDQLAESVAPISVFPASTRTVNAAGQTMLSYPKGNNFEPIIVSAGTGWVKQTKDYEIQFLKGDCSVRQGKNSVQGPQAVVWISKKKDQYDKTREVTVFLESENSRIPLRIELDQNNDNVKIFDQKWVGRFTTTTSVDCMIMNPVEAQAQNPAIYQRAMEMMLPESSVINQVGYVATAAATANSAAVAAPRYRNYHLNPRNDAISIMFELLPNNPDRGIVVITKGLNLIVDGITGDNLLMGDTVDISADNAVIWMDTPGSLSGSGEHKEDANKDFEVYLEGNIIFRDAKRTIQANRMYYDAKNHVAYILNGRIDSPIEGLKGITGTIHLKAEILRQLGDGFFTAKNAVLTTSQLGEPSSALRSKTLTIKEQTVTSPFGGQPKNERLLVAENNYVTAGTVPVFYWPWMAADLNDPTFYIKNIAYGNSSIYGNQIKTVWNPFQLLNIRNRPDWLNGDVNAAWLEKRGIAHGARFQYSPSNCFGLRGITEGNLYYWGISDKGLDSLGGPRSDVAYPHRYRYRFAWKHQQEIESIGKHQGPWLLSAQVGKVSDGNVTNNYFHNDWLLDDNKTTSVGIKKVEGNSTLSVFSEYALDDCFTNANWLPRLDHFLMGQSLLNDHLTWYEHTRVGFMDYNTASAPYDWARDGRYFSYLPWELSPNSPTSRPPNPNNLGAPTPDTLNLSGEVFSTRHELDLPFSLGPVRVVPFALGDFSHWGKDRSGDDVQRLYGQGGVRMNLPLWNVRPNCSSRTWYINGLAHKIDFDAELSYSQAAYAQKNKGMNDLIMTDALDSWTVEEFRRRYSVITLGNPYNNIIPAMFDPRYYALRSGMGGDVSAGNMEIADDMTLCRFGITNRWQTKRGPVGHRHIIDWVTFSTHFNYYPESKYNFGKPIGLLDYDFLWHVGDRFSLFSSGLYDTFPQGQRITRVGANWMRPERGSFSAMLDQFDGLIQKTYLTLSAGYTMNEKYSFQYTTAFDVTDNWTSTGHNFQFVRNGESFRMFVGAVYSDARRDWSFTFGIEPVFMRGIAQRMLNTSNQTINGR